MRECRSISFWACGCPYNLLVEKTICSVFTGIGGLDYGLEGGFAYLGRRYEENGFRTVFACDISPHAKRIYESIRPDRTMTLGSIVDIIKQNETDPIIPKADVVTGGFPCQPFSLSGKRKGFNEFKGMLYSWMCQMVEIVRPKIVVAENVKGLTMMPGAVVRIRDDFARRGYRMQSCTLNAMDFGVPQRRERIIFLGAREDMLTPQAKECLDDDPVFLFPRPSLPRVSCREAFAGLSEPNAAFDNDQRAYSKAKITKGQGQIEIDLDRAAMTIRAEHHGNIEFRRLSLKHGGCMKSEADRGLKERRLTVRECARLQSFPDEFRFLPAVSASEAYRLIGNAVPPLLGHAIGQRLAEIWGVLFGDQ